MTITKRFYYSAELQTNCMWLVILQ